MKEAGELYLSCLKSFGATQLCEMGWVVRGWGWGWVFVKVRWTYVDAMHEARVR